MALFGMKSLALNHVLEDAEAVPVVVVEAAGEAVALQV